MQRVVHECLRPLEAEAHCEHDAVVVVLDLGIHAWLGIADAHDGREGVVLAGAPLVHIGHVGVEALVVIAKTQREVLDMFKFYENAEEMLSDLEKKA